MTSVVYHDIVLKFAILKYDVILFGDVLRRLSRQGDFFSAEMENVLKAVVPAYPRAWVVKADAHAFLR